MSAQPQRRDETESFASRTGKGPDKTIKAGHGVQVKTWTNTGQNGEYQSAVIEHSYKDDKDQWQTQKLNVPTNALLSLARALEQTHDQIVAKDQAKDQGQSR